MTVLGDRVCKSLLLSLEKMSQKSELSGVIAAEFSTCSTTFGNILTVFVCLGYSAVEFNTCTMNLLSMHYMLYMAILS